MDEPTKQTRTAPRDMPSPSWEVTSRSVTIDDLAPHYDFGVAQHLVVDAPPELTYQAIRHLDLLTVRSPVSDLAMWVRGLPERLGRHGLTRARTRLTIDDLLAGGDWVLLGEDPGREIILGTVGRFWTPIVRIEPVSAEEFADYGKPGRGKIVFSMSVRPYGGQRSLASYDIRTTVTDPLTQRIFGLYWRTVAPFVKAIMRATLRAAAEQASAAAK